MGVSLEELNGRKGERFENSTAALCRQNRSAENEEFFAQEKKPGKKVQGWKRRVHQGSKGNQFGDGEIRPALASIEMRTALVGKEGQSRLSSAR